MKSISKTVTPVKLVGVMQGRLLPKYQGRYQAHPRGYWQEEFPIARSLGLNLIEFILDFNDAHENPLLNQKGIEEVLALVEQTGVQVRTVCADYFMEAPLHSDNVDIANESIRVLKTLIDHGLKLALTDIVIPCVDQSSLQSKQDIMRFHKALSSVLSHAEANNINLSLETDLAPEPFAELLDKFDSKKVTVNYDTGNSASLGYDPVTEFKYYGKKVTDIHIKDRMLGGGSVVLGTGNTDFSKLFDIISECDYRGPLIFQAYRNESGTDIFRTQFDWFKENYLEYGS
jgi:sugar phosphate isomerase/epimerase